MKILHFQKLIGLAGSELYLLELLPRLESRGLDVGFAALVPDIDMADNEAFFDQLDANGIPYTQIKAGRIPSPLTALELSQYAERNDFDLLHSHLLFADVTGAMTRLWAPDLQLVSTKHGFRESHIHKHGLKGPVKRDWYWLLAKLTELTITRSFAVSEGLRSLYVDADICPADKIDVIHHGAMEGRLSDDVPGKKYRFSDKQVLLPGRLVKFKGHKLAIESMETVLQSVPDAKMVIVGDGPEWDNLQGLVADMGIEDSVMFVGWQDDMTAWMRHSDIVAIPSIGEGFGLVFLEAFMSGKPVVAFDVAAANEIVEAGETGLLAPPWNVDKFGEALAKLLANDDLRERQGTRASNSLDGYFSFERVVSETLAFYQRACPN